MGVQIDVEKLRAFEQPVSKRHSAILNWLNALNKVKQVAGEGLNLDEYILETGRKVETAFNEKVVPGMRNQLQTLASSADNAEAVQRLMAGLEVVSTSSLNSTDVNVGVQPMDGIG